MKLSVITITYNDSEGLRKTIESLRPLNMAWEHVIIDSSPEVNIEILKKLEPTWPLNYHEMEPVGIYAAFNKALSVCTGDIVWFLNSGDLLFDAETLLKNVALFGRDAEIDLIVSRTRLTRDSHFLYDQIPNSIFVKNLIGTNKLCHQGVLYRRTAFVKTGLYSLKYRLAADYEHLLKCYIQKLKTLSVTNVLAEFDMSGTSSQYKNVFAEYKKIHEEIKPLLSKFLNFQNSFFRQLGWCKICVIKFFSNSRWAAVLRPLWLKWNRSK